MADPTPQPLNPETLLRMMSPEHLTPERLAAVKQIAPQMARDPELLAAIERMLEQYGPEFDKLAPSAEHFKSFGWSEEMASMPSPRAAAAAVGAAVAAMVVPVPV